MSEYIAMILNKEKFVISPARHSLINYTIDPTFATLDVKGADIDA